MASINKVILVGNLGADPELRYIPGGDAVCTLRLATSDKWKDKDSGEMREATEWHRVILFRRLAEVAREYLRKGAPVYVEGRLRTRKWQDKDGKARLTTEIEGSDMKLLGGPRDDSRQAPSDLRARPDPELAAHSTPTDWEKDLPF